MRLKVILLVFLVFLLLSACVPDRWQPVEGGENLTQHASWQCYGSVTPADDGLHVGAGEEFNMLTNTYGPRLRVGGDFAVAARLTPVAEGLGGLSLIGVPGRGEWWEGTRRLNVGLNAGQLVVNYFDGTSFLPAGTATFPVSYPGGPVALIVRRESGTFSFLVAGELVGRWEDPGVFPENTAYLGFVVQPHSALVLHELQVKGTLEAEVAVLPPLDDAAYVPGEPPLRELAAAHDLRIGAAVGPGALRCEPAYRKVLGTEFNLLTTENAFKFDHVHPEPERYNFADTDAILAFAEEHDMLVRGHTLVWHQSAPGWLENTERPEEAWEQLLQEHIQTVVGQYRGRIAVWDVVNEAIGEGGGDDFRDTFWLRGMGPDYVDQAFRWAHEADPDALLFYNDYGAEGSPTDPHTGVKSQQVFDLVRGMQERGVPIHGVGLQMHLELGNTPSPEQVLLNMQNLHALGLQVHITELDIRLPENPVQTLRERQAELYRAYMDVCLAAPNCTAFITWGFTDRHSWIPAFFPGMDEGLIFDRQYRPKLVYEALHEALSQLPTPLQGANLRLGPEDFGAECDCGP